MADDIKKVEIAITSTYDGSGAVRAAADQEKLLGGAAGANSRALQSAFGPGVSEEVLQLTIGQENLAPATAESTAKLAEFDAALTKANQALISGATAAKPYIISSEAEYLAVQKAHDALAAKIPVLQAAGRDTASYEASLANLSNALSTEQALTIAESMEQKAVAAARLEAAAAAREEALANKENTASGAMNATSLREVMTIVRELEAGRITRVPGSMSILLQQFSNIGGMLQAGLIGGSAAAFILFDVVKGIRQEWEKVAEETAKAAEQASVPEFIQSIEKQRDAVAAEAADMQSFTDALAAAAEKENDLNTQLQNEIALLQGIERARAALTSAQKELEIARVQREENTGQITPEQAAEQRAAIEKKYIEKEQQDRERTQNEELESREVALRRATEQQQSLNEKYAVAQQRVNADKAHAAEVAIDPKSMLEHIAALEAKMEAERQIIQAPASAADLGAKMAFQNTHLLERQQAYLNMLEEQFQRYQATQSPEYQAALKAREDAAQQARSNAENNNKLTADLTKQVSDLKEEIAKTRPIEERTARTKAATVDEQEAGRIAQQFQSDARVISEYDRSKNPSPELISRAATAMKEMQDMLTQFGPLLQTIANLQGLVADLKAAVTRMGENVSQGNNTWGTAG